VNTPEELFDRLEMRNEFVNLGVEEVFGKLKEVLKTGFFLSFALNFAFIERGNNL
jgi:hypothetical protein